MKNNIMVNNIFYWSTISDVSTSLAALAAIIVVVKKYVTVTMGASTKETDINVYHYDLYTRIEQRTRS